MIEILKKTQTTETLRKPDRLINESTVGQQAVMLLGLPKPKKGENVTLNRAQIIKAAGEGIPLDHKEKINNFSFHERDKYWKDKDVPEVEKMNHWKKSMNAFLDDFKTYTHKPQQTFLKRILNLNPLESPDKINADTVYNTFMEDGKGDVEFFAKRIVKNCNGEEIEKNAGLIQKLGNIYGKNSAKISELLTYGIFNAGKNTDEFIKSSEKQLNTGNIEEDLWTILPHSPETFPWLQKEEYYRQRDEFIPSRIPFYEKYLKDDPEYKYKDDPEITRILATIHSRAFFAATHLCEYNPLEEKYGVPINIRPETNLVNKFIPAQECGIFELGDQEINDLKKVPPSQIDQLRLKDIHIDFNINNLGMTIEDIKNKATDALMNKILTVDTIEEWKKESIELEAIKQEVLTAHETAHAFYEIIAASNPISLKKFIEELKKYPSLPWDRDVFYTDKEFRLYYEAPIEQDAHKWEEAFLKHYYPKY